MTSNVFRVIAERERERKKKKTFRNGNRFDVDSRTLVDAEIDQSFEHGAFEYINRRVRINASLIVRVI